MDLDEVADGEDPILRLEPVHLAVLNLLAAGMSARQIANELHFHMRTVQRRVSELCACLEAASVSEVVHIAHQRGIIT